MKNNKGRPEVWRTGSFTKNFRWGEKYPGLKRLHDAINVGFQHKLQPVLRKQFRQRLSSAGFIDFIPVNFFLYNQAISGDDYIAVDELVYQAVSFPYSDDFDRLAIFSLLLSEVGKWKGMSPEQSNPAEWARYFAIDYLRDIQDWTPNTYSADAIEEFLKRRKEFSGETRKLSTNLSFLFEKAKLGSFRDISTHDWMSNVIFLALDRYYLKLAPSTPSVGWAIDVLAENDVIDLSGNIVTLELQNSIARLFLATHATERFQGAIPGPEHSLIAVLSRTPLVAKHLPDIVQAWLSKRLFVELVKDDQSLKDLISTDFDSTLEQALKRIHNTVPEAQISGSDLIRIFRDRE